MVFGVGSIFFDLKQVVVCLLKLRVVCGDVFI